MNQRVVVNLYLFVATVVVVLCLALPSPAQGPYYVDVDLDSSPPTEPLRRIAVNCNNGDIRFTRQDGSTVDIMSASLPTDCQDVLFTGEGGGGGGPTPEQEAAREQTLLNLADLKGLFESVNLIGYALWPVLFLYGCLRRLYFR